MLRSIIDCVAVHITNARGSGKSHLSAPPSQLGCYSNIGALRLSSYSAKLWQLAKCVGHAMATVEGNFLEKLMKAFSVLEKQSSVNTKDFIDAIEKLFPVFDHLGNFFCIFITLWR